jgi:superfamily II DNA or RNA helicase
MNFENDKIFEPTTQYRVIYVYSRPDANEVAGCLKIGDAIVHTSQTADQITPEQLEEAANARIRQQVGTAGVRYALEHVELAVVTDGGKAGQSFRDYDVHNVLLRSGLKKKKVPNGGQEWFAVNLEDAKRAISCVKRSEQYFSIVSTDIDEGIKFRGEQEEFIKKAGSWFKNGDFSKPKDYLGNLKMRFGKTLTSLEIAKRNPDIHKVLILTHRPVVNDGWFTDFKKIFTENDDEKWLYGSKKSAGTNFEDLKNSDNFVYFASMQDLRGSWNEQGDLIKNSDVFDTQYDLVTIDEAHEGTQTELAEKVLQNLQVKYRLHLSGTPFNLKDQFNENNTSTWDYVDEQDAKRNWDKLHPESSNPYADLPTVKMFTYDLTDALRLNYAAKDKQFNFADFFKVDEDQTETFVKPNALGKDVTHEYHPFRDKQSILRFLNLITNTDISSDKHTYLPYSNQQFASYLKHTLWLLPGVDACRSLEALLAEHTFFSRYSIVNAAGDGTYEEASAIDAVNEKIGDKPAETYTITLSCGQLTTGVTVPPWTGVMMLSNIESASTYLQTAFRAQTPATFGGQVKTNCYIFDFAPDRALSMAVAANQISKKPGEGNDKVKRAELKKFLEFFPIIAADGAKLEPFNVDNLMQTLKSIYIAKAVENGFDTPVLYDQHALRKLNLDDIRVFNSLKTKVGSQQAVEAKNKVDIVRHNLDEAKISGKELLDQGWNIITKCEYNEYKKPVPKSLIEDCKTSLEKLQVAINEVEEFAQNINLNNFDNLSQTNKDKHLELGDNLEVAVLDARTILQNIIKIANAKEKLPKSEEQKRADEERKQAKNAQAILRAVAVRIPLLVFGFEGVANGQKINGSSLN